MMMLDLVTSSSRRGVLVFLLVASTCTSVSASQALTPHTHAASAATFTGADNKTFILLPGGQTVDDVLRETQDIFSRGGATATSSQQPPLQEEQQQDDPLLGADYIGDTKLPTDMGNFRMRAYRARQKKADNNNDDESSLMGTGINANVMEPIVIYAADKPPFGDTNNNKLLENVPIRIHDQCLTSEVFRSRRYVNEI
jgi:GTP cyclohydrolase II